MRPADQTFPLTLPHTSVRVSEALAYRSMDVDLKAASIGIRTLKRRAERWREVPVPPELLRALKCVHALRSASAKAAGVPLPTIAAALGHANLQTTAVYITAAGREARDFLVRMWERVGNSGGSSA